MAASDMKRCFSNLAAGISLLLCVAVCVLWVRSQRGSDTAAWTYDRGLRDGSAASLRVFRPSKTRAVK
jgi:hypothetical protein